MPQSRVVVGMAAERGLEYGVALLERLRAEGLESHLVLTAAAATALGEDAPRVRALAAREYAEGNQAARISSGSFLTRGMIVAPCDARALASIAMGLATNLVYRAADVTLKEGRPLVLGLPEVASSTVERDMLARAAGVPGLVVLPLASAVDKAAADLVAHVLGVESGASAG